MFSTWLKRYVPRGLYTRAALILILPVVALQLVVSVVFVQRHFEDVTEQMTSAISRELDLLQAAPSGVPPEEMKAILGIAARPVTEAEVPGADIRPWYDFSGIVVIRTLKRDQPELRAVSLADDDVVRVFIGGPAGVVEYALERERVSASNPHQLFVNMIVFGAVLTAIAFVYLRNQLRPVTRLADVAAAFGRGQSLPYRPGGATEVRAAGAAFLDMRDRIERHIEQRTLMLSGVSHDLRTPLTRLRLGLSMLDDADREPLERDAAEMQEMIEGFLDFARGTAGDDPVPVDPARLVREIVEDAKRGGKPATLSAVDGGGHVDLRPIAVRRAVENLIGNAVRYSDRAAVSVHMDADMLRIRVEDDGPGIPPDRREEAIRPFQRLDPARNQDRGGGVGLGLSIAADIARAHGGTLRLDESPTLGGLLAELVIPR
ncbi:MAG: ATP-binding protein [Pseudooceanicola sp.]